MKIGAKRKLGGQVAFPYKSDNDWSSTRDSFFTDLEQRRVEVGADDDARDVNQQP